MFSPVSDVVLSSFPGILADEDLCLEFMVKWKMTCQKLTKTKKVSHKHGLVISSTICVCLVSSNTAHPLHLLTLLLSA